MSMSFPFLRPRRARNVKDETTGTRPETEDDGSRGAGPSNAGANGARVVVDDAVDAVAATSDLAANPKLSSSSSSSSSRGIGDNNNKKKQAEKDETDHDEVVRVLRAHVARYARRDNALGLRVSLATLAYFAATAFAPWLASRAADALGARSAADALGLPPSALLAIKALLWSAWGVFRAAAYVRSFMLMHDCVHGSLFESRALNKRFGFLFGVCAWLSSRGYQRKHLVHHMRLGIEEEGPWDADRTAFWTVKEWEAWKPSASKLAARVVRAPSVYFPLTGPIFLLLFGSTAPAVGPNLTPLRKFQKLYEANAVRIALIVAGTALIGALTSWRRVAAEYAAGFVAMAVGVATFSVTHTYGEGYIKKRASHSRDDAALRGSSRVVLPRWLADHVFMNIVEHHIHHFDARVPCYNLRKCHEEAPEGIWERAGLHSLTSWRDVRGALGLALWDEERERHVPFPPLSSPLPSSLSSLPRLPSFLSSSATRRLAANAA